MTKRTALAVFLVSAVLCAQDASAVAISQATGKVLFLKNGSYTWAQISAGQVLGTGDQLKTAGDATATVTFDDGSTVSLNPGSAFTMQESSASGSSLQLKLGSLRAWISKSLNRRFQVRTPTAVCSVRGTEFSVEVGAGGDTRVQMFNGLLAVSDNNKNEVLLKDTQGVEVTAAGLGTVTDSRSSSDQQTAASSSDDKRAAKREVGLQMSKEEVQSAAAEEAKLAEYQSGKVMIDVNGNRVRLEQYIVRPAADQFKLVILNEREDRFDYFFYHGTFNTVLPTDISVALRQLPGCIGAACQYFMTGYRTGRSNTIDNMLEVTGGGHQIDVNANGDPADDVTAAYDPVTDTFVPVAGAFFQTLYDQYSLTFNGVAHESWNEPNGTNVPNYLAATLTTEYRPLTLQTAPGCAPPDCTYNEVSEGIYHDVVYLSDAGNTMWEKYDSYVISDEGKIARTSDFAGIGMTGSAFKQQLLNWNFQTIVTASEFQGRKIDLVVEPKLFIQSGLIP